MSFLEPKEHELDGAELGIGVGYDVCGIMVVPLSELAVAAVAVLDEFDERDGSGEFDAGAVPSKVTIGGPGTTKACICAGLSV